MKNGVCHIKNILLTKFLLLYFGRFTEISRLCSKSSLIFSMGWNTDNANIPSFLYSIIPIESEANQLSCYYLN